MSHERRLFSSETLPDLETTEGFIEANLQVMEAKHHWADAAFPGIVPKPAMRYHFRDEYATFVKPFPHYLRGVLHQLPEEARFDDIRSDLIENIEEEETGKHFAGASHAELFLLMPQDPTFGFDVSDFDTYQLLPRAAAYRAFLEDASHNRGWETGAVVTTLFLEGTKRERESVFFEEFGLPQWKGLPLEEHPLRTRVVPPVQFENLKLTEVHHTLDAGGGAHRKAAWNMIMHGIAPQKRTDALGAMHEALELWHLWRDEVADACGVELGAYGRPQLKNQGTISE